MSISLGLYDLFSYILPGSIYLFIVARSFGLITSVQQTQFDLAQILGLFGLAYLAGILLDPIATKFWYYKFFFQKDMKSKIIKELQNNNPNLEIDFTEKQQGILLSKIHNNVIPKKDSSANESSIDRYSILKIMFRNVSFSLFILSIVQLIFFFVHQYDIVDILFCGVSACFSVIAGIEARKFDLWATTRIFETFVALAIEPSLLVRVKSKGTKNKRPALPKRAG